MVFDERLRQTRGGGGVESRTSGRKRATMNADCRIAEAKKGRGKEIRKENEVGQAMARRKEDERKSRKEEGKESRKRRNEREQTPLFPSKVR